MPNNEHSASGSRDLPGFDTARTLLWCYEARERVRTRLTSTDFLADDAIVAVHVDNTTRADRLFLTAFDSHGARVATDTLYIDELGENLDVTPEFDHDFTNLWLPSGSELQEYVDREFGWVINMAVLREYDIDVDRRATQRKIFLAHLGDMIASGQAEAFGLGGFSQLLAAHEDDDDEDEETSDAA